MVVFFVNPPNSDDVSSGGSEVVIAKGGQHTDWANFPHFGILSLASHIDSFPSFQASYIDGVLYSLDASPSGVARAVFGYRAGGSSSRPIWRLVL